MIRRHLVVHGQVQGVGYRYACEDVAARLGVNGWVRNVPDGTVEVVLEGDETAVDAMAAWVRQGPRLAEVTHVDIEDEEPEGLQGFVTR
ncbi:acylphosphatase [Georgenia halophila]|uniref:acylphosphatase n=1 Tax=Georgenia halophila TaxID=620889 RepID=A0ABP8LEY3_9MICO